MRRQLRSKNSKMHLDYMRMMQVTFSQRQSALKALGFQMDGWKHGRTIACPLCHDQAGVSLLSRDWDKPAGECELFCRSCFMSGDVILWRMVLHKEDYTAAHEWAVKCGFIVYDGNTPDEALLRRHGQYYHAVCYTRQRLYDMVLRPAEYIAGMRALRATVLPDRCLYPLGYAWLPHDWHAYRVVAQGHRIPRRPGVAMPCYTDHKISGLYIIDETGTEYRLPFSWQRMCYPEYMDQCSVCIPSSVHTIIYIDDPISAVRWNLWSQALYRYAPPVWFVARWLRDPSTIHTGAALWPLVQAKTYLYWSLLDDPCWLLSATKAPKGSTLICMTKALPHDCVPSEVARYPCQADYRRWIDALIKHSAPYEQRVTYIMSQLTDDRRRELLEKHGRELNLSSSAAVHVQKSPLSRIQYQNVWISETDEGWATDSGLIISPIAFYINEIRLDSKPHIARITLKHKGRSVVVSAPLAAVQNSLIKWLEQQSLTLFSLLPTFDRKYRSRLLDISQRFLQPRIISSSAADFGWTEQALRFPHFSITQDGAAQHVSLERVSGPALLLPSMPSHDALSDMIQSDAFKILCIYAAGALYSKHSIYKAWMLTSPYSQSIIAALQAWLSWVADEPLVQCYRPLPYPASPSVAELNTMLAQIPQPHVIIAVQDKLAQTCGAWYNWRTVHIEAQPMHMRSMGILFHMLPGLLKAFKSFDKAHIPSYTDVAHALTDLWPDRLPLSVRKACKAYGEQLDHIDRLTQYSPATRLIQLLTVWAQSRLLPVVRDATDGVSIRYADIVAAWEQTASGIKPPSVDAIKRRLLSSKCVIAVGPDEIALAQDAWDFWTCMTAPAVQPMPDAASGSG